MGSIFSQRMGALLRKEFSQIRRDKRLAFSLIAPPILQLVLFSLVLNATVSNLKLGIIDDSRTPESRGLTSTLTESKSFKLAGYFYDVNKLGDAISRGDVDAGVVIPHDYAKDLHRGTPVTVQLLLNAMNANTAAIAQGYAEGVLQNYNANVMPLARASVRRISSTTSKAFASSISTTATAAPSWANSCAVAAPIPPPPPVTIATFPASLDIEFSQSVGAGIAFQ